MHFSALTREKRIIKEKKSNERFSYFLLIFFVDGVEMEKRRKGKCKRKEIYYNFVNREEYEMERKNFGKRGKKKIRSEEVLGGSREG